MPPVNSAEAKVADALRAAGIAVECNVFLENYEVDILAENHLIIEVDGYHHYARDTRSRDSAKEQYLTGAGYQLLRVKNADVHQPAKLESFVQEVKSQLRAGQGSSIPTNTPLRLPELEQLKLELEAKEKAKRQRAVRPRPEAAPSPRRTDRAMFLEWLEQEQVTEKEESDSRSPGKGHHRRR